MYRLKTMPQPMKGHFVFKFLALRIGVSKPKSNYFSILNQTNIFIMDIKSTTIIKTAEETTYTAFYEIEFTVRDQQLLKIQTSVFALPQEGSLEKRHLGFIISENDNVSCSLPGDISLMSIFTEFEIIVEQIKDELNPQSSSVK